MILPPSDREKVRIMSVFGVVFIVGFLLGMVL